MRGNVNIKFRNSWAERSTVARRYIYNESELMAHDHIRGNVIPMVCNSSAARSTVGRHYITVISTIDCYCLYYKFKTTTHVHTRGNMNPTICVTHLHDRLLHGTIHITCPCQYRMITRVRFNELQQLICTTVCRTALYILQDWDINERSHAWEYKFNYLEQLICTINFYTSLYILEV